MLWPTEVPGRGRRGHEVSRVTIFSTATIHATSKTDVPFQHRREAELKTDEIQIAVKVAAIICVKSDGSELIPRGMEYGCCAWIRTIRMNECLQRAVWMSEWLKCDLDLVSWG